jgi:PilZ domain-containing protein
MTVMLANNSASIATALLLSEDALTVTLLTQCLEELAISTDVCICNADFVGVLNQKKIEAVIVDSPRADTSARFLDIVRSSRSNRSAVTFAIHGRGQNFSSCERANFLFESPLSKEAIRKTLKVSFGLIVRERRRYFRCPISTVATLRSDEFGSIRCEVINISEGGMALNAPVKLSLKLSADVGFEIPNQLSRQIVKSEVVWSDDHGRVGIRFLSQTALQRVELQGWLARQLESSFPERVLKTFQAVTGSGVDVGVHPSTV